MQNIGGILIEEQKSFKSLKGEKGFMDSNIFILLWSFSPLICYFLSFLCAIIYPTQPSLDSLFLTASSRYNSLLKAFSLKILSDIQ